MLQSVTHKMKHSDQWLPTKVVARGGDFSPSRDVAHLAAASRIISSRQISAYDNALREYAGGRLLDMGCGKVPYYAMYRDLVEETVCIDWADSLHGNPFTDYEVDLNAPLPIRDRSFDTVLLTDVLEHIAEPGCLMLEVSRILAPAGVVIIGVPFFYWLHETPHDYYRYTEFALRRLAIRSGLEVLYLKPYGGVPEIICDISAKCLSGAGLHKAAAGFSAVATFALSLSPIQKLSRRTSDKFPLGYVMVAQRKQNH